MAYSRLFRFARRFVLLAAVCALPGAGTALAMRAHAGGGGRPSNAAGGMAALALAVPSPGDVSYAVARVRIAAGSRLTPPAGLSGQQNIFVTRLGGLTVTARSRSWRSLRATVHVYVVVSRVRGGSSSLRDVAFFILRRSALHGPANAKVVFTLANARAQVGSFWVHSVDRAGYASVFAVRDILSTALDNWSRYIRALQLAHAVAAAAHPVVQGSAPTASAAALSPKTPGPWIGGQRPSGHLMAMYRLVAGAIGDPMSYAALKKDPVVADFIQNELGNPALAARWRSVVAQVPLKVPDAYAAAAQEEKRFSRVRPPKVTHAVVAFDDPNNSSSQGLIDALRFLHTADLKVSKSGTGTGTVTESPGGPGGIVCGSICTQTVVVSGIAVLTLHAAPDAGSRLGGWSGCGHVTAAGDCQVFLDSFSNVTATFDLATSAPPPSGTYPLSVIYQPEEAGQSGSVTSTPTGITCPGSQCTSNFPSGATVTLTASPSPGSYFDYWAGCGSTFAESTCTVTMDQARSVTAYFGYP